MSEKQPNSNGPPESIGRLADLVQILTNDHDIIIRRGPLHTQGRLTFGHKYAGADGVGLFILSEGGDGDDDE